MTRFYTRIICLIFFIQSPSFLFAQVNLQTGAVQVGFPLYSFSNPISGLSLNISLDYFSRGLKVNDVASDVGLGWNLNAGGVIVRNQNGEPDDQDSRQQYPPLPYSNSGNGNILYGDNDQSLVDNYYPNGYLFSEHKVHFENNQNNYDDWVSIPEDLGFVPRFRDSQNKNYKLSRRSQADREQDIFNYSFEGRQGQFIIGKGGQIVDLNNSKLRIEKTELNQTANNIRTTINSFKITTEAGIVYKFQGIELTAITNPEDVSTDNSGSFTLKIARTAVASKYIITKWFLTEISNPLTNEKITFAYEDNVIDFISEKAISYQELLKQSDGSSAGKTVSILELRTKVTSKRLKKITLPDGHSVEFTYSTINRLDVNGDYPLSSISINYNGSFLYRYDFNLGYLYKKQIKRLDDVFQTNDVKYLRLCLLSVQKNGSFNASEPPYQFSYYLGDNTSDANDCVPPRYCPAQDHYGYYNRASIVNIDLDVQDKATYESLMISASLYRNCYNGLAKNGVLKSLTYPTGGSLSFDYEQNDANDNGTNKYYGGVRVSRTTLYDGINVANKIQTRYSYKSLNAPTLSSGWGFETLNYQTNYTFKYVNSPESGYNSPGKFLSDFANQLIVNQMAFYGSASTASVTSALASPGNFANFSVQYLMVYIALEWLRRFYIGILNPFQYYDIHSFSFYPVWLANPVGHQYSAVQSYNESTANSTGQTTYSFTSPNFTISDLTFPYPKNQRILNWKYGLPLQTTIYDKDNNTVSQTTNDYNFYVNDYAGNINYINCRVQPNTYTHGIAGYYTYTIDPSTLSSIFYYPIAGSSVLKSVETKMYKNNVVVSANNSSYSYNTDYLLSAKSESNSKGETIETIYKYVNDYTFTGPIATLKANNNISAPVLTETYITKSGVKKLLSGSIIEYDALSNGNIQPVKTYSLKTDRPVNDNSLTAFSSSQLIRDGNYYKATGEMKYDNNGNLVQTNKLLEVSNTLYTPEKTSVVVDKSNPQLVIATATNASYTDIAYTSFETPSDVNNWSYNSALVFSDDWITGNASLKMDNIVRSVNRQVLNTGVKYKITFWAKNVGGSTFVPLVNKNNDQSNGYFINNITPAKVYTNSATNWSLYECYVTNASSIYIHNQDPANQANGVPVLIDEVRLYPEGSSMSTATYNIQGLKTSVIDASNKIQYMEYDGLGRLRLIRDEDRNILKTYEYNFKQ